MDINVKDMLTLSDNNQYVVIGKVKFYYLIDKNDFSNIKFCYEDGKELVEIEDKELVTRLIELFVRINK